MTADTGSNPNGPARRAADNGATVRGEVIRGGKPAQGRELRAQGKKTMGKLLDAGMKVFGKRGYHAVRVDDIVKKAKTSHGTFYLYFSNKEDLLHALMENCIDAMSDLAEQFPPISPDEEGRLALRVWLDEYMDLYRHYAPVVRAWTEADTPGSPFGRMGQETLGAFAQRFVRRLEDVDLPPDVDPTIASLAFVAMIERFNYFLVTRQIDFDRDAVLDTLTRVFHMGLFAGERPGVAART